jgi:hypothetical protein
MCADNHPEDNLSIGIRFTHKKKRKLFLNGTPYFLLIDSLLKNSLRKTEGRQAER